MFPHSKYWLIAITLQYYTFDFKTNMRLTTQLRLYTRIKIVIFLMYYLHLINLDNSKQDNGMYVLYM